MEGLMIMKKFSFLILGFMSIKAASADILTGGCPSPFQGFHLGANIGYGIGYDKQPIRSNNGNLLLKNKQAINGVDGGLGTGYTTGCGNWRYGIGFDVNWTNASGKLRVLDLTL